MASEVQGSEDLDDIVIPKYARLGWFDQDRFVDKVCIIAVKEMQGELLPQRWKWSSPEDHVKIHGKITWAKTKSYHLLLINGHHILRIWTDTPKRAIVDINNAVATSAAGFDISDIPESCARKCKPLTKRVRLMDESQIVDLMNVVKKVYGL